VQRLQKIISFVAVVCATALMWSDTAIKWWTNIVNFFLRVNHDATTSVMNNRPTGDADLHAVIWGACAVLVVIAWTMHWKRLVALELLSNGSWKNTGVRGAEAFPADPFLNLLGEYGAHHGMVEMGPGLWPSPKPTGQPGWDRPVKRAVRLG